MAMAALAAASFGMSALGSISQYQQGQYAREASIRSAEELQQQSQFVQQTAGQQINANDYRASHILSRIQATFAASGITTEGSPSVAIAESGEEARINDMYTKYVANVKSQQLDYEATLTKIQGEQETQAGTIGAIGGAISGGIRSYGAYKGDPALEYFGSTIGANF